MRGEQEGNKSFDGSVELSGGRAASREGANHYLTITYNNYTTAPRRGAHTREAPNMHTEGPKFLMVDMGRILGAAFEAEGFLPVPVHQAVRDQIIGGTKIAGLSHIEGVPFSDLRKSRRGAVDAPLSPNRSSTMQMRGNFQKGLDETGIQRGGIIRASCREESSLFVFTL
jgi:hypothetical protein